MKKRSLILLIGAALILAFSATGLWAEEKAAPAAEGGEYHVGCIFAITGKASWLGEPERNTAEMVAKEINDAGGINGKKLVLHIEDDQGDNTQAVNAVNKLIKKDKVCAIIGPSTSGTSMAVVPIAQEAQIPLISCAGAAVIVEPVAERKWIFKVPQKDSDCVRRIYDHMTSKGIKDIGIITTTSGFGGAGRDQLKKIAEEYAIKIVADETYDPTATDMTAQLVKIKNAGAQAVVNWSIEPAQSIVPQNMKQLKMTIPLYQSHGFGNIKYAQAAGDAGEGIIFPAGRLLAVDTVSDDDPQKKVLVSYRDKYEKTYSDKVSTFGGHAYDALWILANALKKVGDDPAKLRDEIEKTEFVGTAGVFKFSPADHCGLDKTAFEMLTVKDGKFVVLKE
ncbi:MAG: ABC transporter substrate-binding protein [Desulfobacterales bacterium]|nr:ABC transporter substrate-binding protein [Desulfobacterales bacterium]